MCLASLQVVPVALRKAARVKWANRTRPSSSDSAPERRGSCRSAAGPTLLNRYATGAPSLGLGDQLPQHVGQNAAVLVVIDLNGRIDAAADRHGFDLPVAVNDAQLHVL